MGCHQETLQREIMNIKALVSAVIIALSSVAASASTTTTPVQASGATFSDYVLGTFTLAGLSNVAGTLGFAHYVLIAPTFQIALPTVTFNSASVHNDSLGFTMSSAVVSDAFLFSGLTAGTYSLKASSSVAGTNFIAAQFTVTSVPEPETFAMLIAGLGLIGSVVRRRNQKIAI